MMGYTQQYEIWHGASLGTLIMIQEKKIKDHMRTLFCHFYERGLQDTSSNGKFSKEHPWAH